MMMKIWIVTIGNSDVQLASNCECRQKGKCESNRIWRNWYDEAIRQKCYGIDFEPQRPYENLQERYRLEPRVLGQVYDSSSPEIRDEIWSYLTFPLLDCFVDKLNENSTQNFGDASSAVVVLLTEQSEIFQTEDKKNDQQCPYWQDTCQLEPILKCYFQEKFPNLEDKFVKFISLAPQASEKGLDNWDYVLDLVEKKLYSLQFDTEAIAEESVETVYVSYQASIPAISSAVQFSCLARFEKKVRFLVKNEYDQYTELVPSSKYLNKIQREKARKLLERHDYAGVKELLATDLDPDAKILLDAAIQWNFAKFDDFKKKLLEYSDSHFIEEIEERTKQKNWCWEAYESAYLGVVRLKQGNTVEAIFHSFRAVEGLLYNWVIHDYSVDKKIFICTKQGDPIPSKKSNKKFKTYGKDLYNFLSEQRKIENDEDIYEFGNSIFNNRNNLFHKLEGKSDKQSVLKFWGIHSGNEQEWKARVLGCLKFIAESKPPFNSLEEASLMFQVHQKLDKAISGETNPSLSSVGFRVRCRRGTTI
jgi:hypothetical protein